jgi:hypothetical protein
LEGPDTVIRIDSVVAEVDIGFRSNHITKNDIVFVLEIVALVVFAAWIYNGISIVKSEVEGSEVSK